MKALAVTALLMCLVACDATEALEAGTVTATISAEGVELNNGLARSVHVFPVGANTAAVINWAPNITNENAIAGRSSRTYALEDLYSIEGEEVLIVYWWYAVHRNGKLGPSDVQSFELSIPDDL
ncbi:MAG: hypothetical protein AAF564_19060 [Bacteroidota bacterium]